MSVFRRKQRDGFSSGPGRICRTVAVVSLACGLVAPIASRAQQPPQREFRGDPVPHPYVPPQSIPPQSVPPQNGSPPGPQADAEPIPPAAAPSPGYQPGFLDALGRWFGDSRTAFESQFKNTQEAIGTMGNTARDAAGSVVAIPGTRVITGRQLCPPAANGAPDCQQGVNTLCRAKGFQGGRSLDVTSGERCPARVYIENRPPKEGECRMETYVTRAMCQ